MLFLLDEKELTFDTQYQVLYFYRCQVPFHRKMLLMLNKMEQKYPKMSFFCIDTDYFNPVCRRFKVESLPEIVILKNRAQIKRISGVMATNEFNQIFADIYDSETPNGEIK
jgi:hypothetical protein